MRKRSRWLGLGLLICAGSGCADDASGAAGQLDGGALDSGALDGAAPLKDAAPSLDAATVVCAELSAAACPPSACLKLSARRIDEATRCYADSAEVGCIDRRPCTAALTLARGPDAGLWQFTSGCLPKGWTESPIVDNGMSYGSAPPPSWDAYCRAADAGR
ncbi:MAG: hypothetical protein JWN48_4874 [Myxococcaceae bacterium]|nr:hypothetical protein [Myxococcaceae bacterium]